MKKLLFPLFMMLFLVGCEEKTDMFGIKYSDYPIAGKAYKHSIVGYYDIYVFDTDGRCRADGYIDDRFVGSIDDYYWWMVEDSIFIDVDKKRNHKYMHGKYFGEYIILDGDTMQFVPYEK